MTIRLALATVCSFAAMALSGCAMGDWTARYDVDAKNILGEWRFAHYQTVSPFSAPPRFDVIEFGDDQAVTLTDSLSGRSFAGSFDLVEQVATLRFDVPDRDEPVELVFGLELWRQVDGDEMLAFKIEDAEAVYLRPDQFLDDDLSGAWIGAGDEAGATMILGENGSFEIGGEGESEGNHGFYRLWESRFGKTMTLIAFLQDHGGFLSMHTYEVGEDTLTLTAFGFDGPDPNMKQKWTRRREVSDGDLLATGNDSVRSREGPERVKSFILDDGVDLTVVFIRGGSFLMGRAKDDMDMVSVFDLIAHDVEVPDFWIGRFEVTHAQYVAIMGENRSFNRRSQLPVNHIRWKETLEFCKRLSERTGWDFNLPTEAQWEYACRAGSNTRFSFGDDEKKLGDYAWYESSKSRWSEIGSPRNVGKKKPNDWGLYDMHGNVWEWCLDRYEDDGFKESDENPDDKEYFEREGLIPRVIKGGGWSSVPSDCRSAARYYAYDRYATIKAGFRVVAMPPDDEVPPAGAKTDP